MNIVAQRLTIAFTVLATAACSASPDSGVSSDVEAKTEAINGGTTAASDAWNWSVKVYYNGALQCGGSLVAPDWVVSVGHCLSRQPSTGYSVMLNSGPTVAASTAIVNPNFVDDGAATGHFDMGLLRLVSPVAAGPGVDFVRPAVDGDDVGTNAIAIGWGMTNHDRDNAALPTHLQQVSLPILPSNVCANVNPARHVVYPDELCAGFSDGSKGVCFGDSGSPLMVQRTSGAWELVGMPSVVASAALAYRPLPFISIPAGTYSCSSYGIFNRTTAMVNWLRQYVPDAAWLPGLSLVAL